MKNLNMDKLMDGITNKNDYNLWLLNYFSIEVNVQIYNKLGCFTQRLVDAVPTHKKE